jgi:hypothetical protein
MTARGTGRGLDPCRNRAPHRCHSAVCSELKKRKTPFRVETQQVIAAQAQHARFDRAFRCTTLRGFKGLAQLAPDYPSHYRPENFSLWGSFSFKGRPNQRGKKRALSR